MITVAVQRKKTGHSKHRPEWIFDEGILYLGKVIRELKQKFPASHLIMIKIT
jgi:hypothetical protein